jgi:hypothetical protein
MCLFLEAISSAADRAILEVAACEASSAGLRVVVGHPSRWPWAKDRPVRATISEEGGCACSLLSDDADWDAETWSMRPEILTRLASTLEILAMRGPKDLVVEALWAGDVPKDTVSVTPSELGKIAKSSHLGTRTRYTVVAEKAG